MPKKSEQINQLNKQDDYIYQIKNLNFNYIDNKNFALEDINLSIKAGDFITICGYSGCGKTTLLKHLKPSLAPNGIKSGEILFANQKILQLSEKIQNQEIGYVWQRADNQIKTAKVSTELEFYLKKANYKKQAIRLKVAEMASFFGIEEWFDLNINELSGGQKQLLNLASIMTLQPRVLILDEPTSQLAPIAASDFLKTVYKINKELGTTILLTEHRLEEVLPLSDKVVVMAKGKIIIQDNPYKVGSFLAKKNHEMFLAMPTPMQVYAAMPKLQTAKYYPITVKEGRQWLEKIVPYNCYDKNQENKDFKVPKKRYSTKKKSYRDIFSLKQIFAKKGTKNIIEFKEVFFRYKKMGADIISNLNFAIEKGKIYAFLGGNGTGKTTTLSLIAGINKPYRGKVLFANKNSGSFDGKDWQNQKIGLLEQEPQNSFSCKTVIDELYSATNKGDWQQKEKQMHLAEIIKVMELENLLNMAPKDLSGGESQKLALAKMFLQKPQIMLLDEPTKGLDNIFKIKLAKFLKSFCKKGHTIIMVSHDLEFCAKYANTCALFFNGNIVTTNNATKFFANNNFYTTTANRMSRQIFSGLVTTEQLIKKLNYFFDN